MDKNVKVAVGAGIAVIAAAAVGFTGILTPSTDGTAIPNAPTRALQQINQAATSLADAPAAKYDGTITVVDGGGRKKVTVENLTVTASGDVNGTVISDGRAEILQADGKTFYKGDEAFWRKNSPFTPSTVTSATKPAGRWALASADLLGVDLPTLLRPSSLGLAVDQQDRRYRTSELSGTAIESGSQTPDKRVQLGVDPTGVTEVEIADSDGGVVGSRRFQADSTIIGVDDDGAITAVRGPIRGTGTTGVEMDLRIDPLDADETRSFYSTVKNVATTLASTPAPGLSIAKPTGGIECHAGSDCVLTYRTSTSLPGVATGQVTFSMTSEVKLNGSPLGPCRGTTTMPINAPGTVSCRVVTGNRAGNVQALSKFEITAVATVDTAALSTAVDASAKTVETAAGWAPTSPKADGTARRYTSQITLAPSGYVYRVGQFAFDGREPDGTLLLVFGPGYDAHVLPDGAFDPNWPGTEQVLATARDAKAAAGDRTVRMVFAEARAAEAARRLLAANAVAGVEVVDVPAAPAS